MPLLRQCFLLGNIRLLRLLGAIRQQENQNISALREINPITGSVVDTELTDALTDGLHVPEVAKGEATDANLNACSCLLVAKFLQSYSEEVSLTDLDHV